MQHSFPFVVPFCAYRMKYRRFAVLIFASALTLVRAQQEEERRAPPIEIPDFSNLDEYIYEPKSSVQLSFRHLSGAKTSFSGGGKIAAPEGAIPLTGTNIARFYHDGAVFPDQRTTGRVDAGGNPIIDPQTGAQVQDPIAPDGRTNSWNYIDPRQTGTGVPAGFIAFHSYSAEVVDPATRHEKSRTTNGLDLAMTRDMGKLFGSRIAWNLVVGMSVNDISSRSIGRVPASVQAMTDYYNLFGQVPPAPPFESPGTGAQPVLDASGNPTFNADGSVQTVSGTASVAIGNEPSARVTKNTSDVTSVLNNWRVRGAYYTFRAGPEFWIPITAHFRVSLSLGAALIYSGTNYTVVETFTPEVGDDIVDAITSESNKLLPGIYADASLQYDVTEKTGFFAGAIYQTAGSYTQTLNTSAVHYATKIDLSNQSGFRAGMSIRF